MLGSEKVHSSTSALMSGYCSANSVAYKPPSDLHYMIIPLLPPPLPSSPFSIFFSLPPHLFSSPLPSLPSKADYFTLQDPQVSDQVVMDELQVFKEACVAYPPGYNILEKRREKKREEETKEKRKKKREWVEKWRRGKQRERERVNGGQQEARISKYSQGANERRVEGE